MHASALTDAGRACTQHRAPMPLPPSPAPSTSKTCSSSPAAQQARPACLCAITMWTHTQPAAERLSRRCKHSVIQQRALARAPSIGAFQKPVYRVRRAGMPRVRAKSSLAQPAYPKPRGCGPSPVAIARYRCTRKKPFCRPPSWDHTTLTLPCQLPVPYKPDYARKLPNYTTSMTPTCSSTPGPIPPHTSETPVLHPMPTIVKQ
ncbi:hypothetical protein COCC4DRAFT_60718 [Bipolaris maydis ATCC 48331]|uniref:Uncharacterized protein n=2 Tax=Cochliobolus heterostrophus TaxID=5016 RepID=M2UKV1_COCH5|nr:uncharacterized protein COCC4DRAFT_60718 [Bipolaris maydis ATCC 48331]EMD88618.1 hypothetical protein COCHEDRAFT_1032792 [Bipolaris maydis C5]ENI05666.1 hypothetical protein COCC4DRAFT_60718 [Bipolaris maydis ATCC 48331]KAJ6205562.1 hypothetical protein PSV09DRAFT_1032792 [Bipolaris maydis]